jgi:hypothetical protein
MLLSLVVHGHAHRVKVLLLVGADVGRWSCGGRVRLVLLVLLVVLLLLLLLVSSRLLGRNDALKEDNVGVQSLVVCLHHSKGLLGSLVELEALNILHLGPFRDGGNRLVRRNMKVLGLVSGNSVHHLHRGVVVRVERHELQNITSDIRCQTPNADHLLDCGTECD